MHRARLAHGLILRFRHDGGAFDTLRVVEDIAAGALHRTRLTKEGHALSVAISSEALAVKQPVLRSRLPAIIDPFIRARAKSAVAEFSDGEESAAETISFSSVHPDAILIPDSIFYGTRGYASFRAMAEGWRMAWPARRGGFAWRGSTTGHGAISSAEMRADDATLIQRTRMCLALRDVPDADARFFKIIQSSDRQQDERRLKQAGLLANPIDPETWLLRKFAIDVDGNSNAWSNLFTRLLAGCCVIKIASPFGYRQWYYDALRPWKHFVPVAADLSDLHEKLEWCRTHDGEAAEIAAAGYDFAVRRTFDSEMAGAVEMLDRRLSGS